MSLNKIYEMYILKFYSRRSFWNVEALSIRNVLENVIQKGKYKLKIANLTRREQFSTELKPIQISMQGTGTRDFLLESKILICTLIKR